MNITTWNVNSVRARLDRVLEWVDAREPDLLCLQEIKCQDAEFPREAFEQRGYRVETYGQKTYNGVALLSRLPMEDVQRDLPLAGDPQARGISAVVDGVRVVNLYVVNGGTLDSDKYVYKLQWLDSLLEWARPHAGSPLVICGDFNIAPADLDVWDPAAFKDDVLCSVPERSRLEALLGQGLTDAYRHLHPGKRAFTWWDYRGNGFPQDHGLRIDHHLVSADVLRRTTAVSIDRESRALAQASDHAPVTLHLMDR